MSIKLSQIASGGALQPSTDQLVTVRSGATDVLVTPGTAAAAAASNSALPAVASVSGSTTINHIAIFADASGTIEDGGALGTSANQSASSVTGTVAAVNGGVTAGHLATFSDTAGTIQDGGATTQFDAAGSAATAQSNAEAFAANASNISSGTLNISRLPTLVSSLIEGTATNNSAPSGYIGEFVSSNVPFASAISLSNGVPADVTSISLTAGDWDVEGNIQIVNTVGEDTTVATAWISLTSATAPDNSMFNQFSGQAFAAIGLSTPKLRVSIASTTTVYLTTQAGFSQPVTACGTIQARRAR